MMGSMGADIFELAWVQATLRLFTLFGWSLFAADVVVAVFDIAIEYQSGRANIQAAAINILKGFFACSLIGVVPVELYKFCISLQNTLMNDLTGIVAGEQTANLSGQCSTVLEGCFKVSADVTFGLLNLLCLIAFAYCVIKIFFQNIKRGGILLVQMAVGSLYMFSVPRGYADGFNQWCKQVAAICLTAFLQTTLLFLGLLTFPDHMLLGLGILLAANEVPRIAHQFGAQYERVLPASSAANLYPFNFSGKTDPQGLYIGRDKYGTNILVDFDRRTEDKTTGNILVLGNSGQGKSYLLKLILTNLRESGKSVICLDPEAEYRELCQALGGCYIDFMSSEYTINPLEPKAWTDGTGDTDATAPEAFRKVTRLSQHIAFLEDFFRSYKDFSDAQIDTIEILLSKLYARFCITDSTDYSEKTTADFPIMEDFYKLCEQEYYAYDMQRKYLYTEETLQEVCLGIHSMCVGSESKYFNGHTNITDSRFLVFCVKGLLDTNKRLKDAMLFNILSFMSNQLLGQGKTAASIDELYLFLTNMTAIKYIRNAMKRVRKKDSSILLASQNIEDFLIPAIREYTKPLFSIPTHQFLFNAGQVNPKEYMDALQVEPSEFELIKHPEKGTCLFRCGNERYLLKVIAPDYKAELFGSAGGR